MESVKLEKATVFYASMFGVVKKEVLEAEVVIKPYAQYSNAVHCSWRAPRKRKRDGIVQGSHKSLVVLEGWGHDLEPHGALAKQADGSSITRYESYSPEYEREFDAVLKAWRQKHPSAKVLDYRDPLA